jgi:hypothetical protein
MTRDDDDARGIVYFCGAGYRDRRRIDNYFLLIHHPCERNTRNNNNHASPLIIALTLTQHQGSGRSID